ncbi:MAG: hypothetical protein ACK4K1_04900 [Flavobacterium sp.]
MKNWILAFACTFSIFSFSQEKYKVVYDYQTGNLSYFKLDKNNKIADTLTKPKFKKHSLVQVQVKNVNPFAIEVKAEVKEEYIHQSGQGFNIGGLLGGIGSFAGQELKINTKGIQEDAKVYGELFKSRGSNVSNKFKDLNEVATNVSAMQTTLLSNLSNPNLTKEEIKKNLLELSKLQEDARLSDPEKNFYKFLTDLELIVQSDKASIEDDLASLANAIESKENQPTLSRGEFAQNQTAMRNLQQVSSSLQTTTNQTTSNISQLKTLFSQLEASSFEQTFDYQMETDKAQLELKFSPSTLASQNNTNKPTVTRQIPMVSAGGFKINTSVALTLNSFGDKNQSFFIDENGIIGSDIENNMVPNLATMINFYPLIGESINFGGTFGVSVPLSDTMRGVNFLVGPALILGSKSRVSISGGLAYGPVSRLTNGLQVGQETSLTSLNNFTKNVYEVGYFFGISFSLFDLK